MCISIADSRSFHRASWANASRAKSPSSSRLMRTRRLRLNSAVTPSLVIVGRDQGLDVLAQVDADNRLAAASHMLAHPTQKSAGVGGQEIAERAPRKKRRARTSGDIGWNVKVGGEIRDDRPHRKIGKPIPKPLDRLAEKIRRDIDRRVHARRTKRIDQDLGLDRRSGAVFEQHDAVRRTEPPSPRHGGEESPSRSGSNNIRRGA